MKLILLLHDSCSIWFHAWCCNKESVVHMCIWNFVPTLGFTIYNLRNEFFAKTYTSKHPITFEYVLKSYKTLFLKQGFPTIFLPCTPSAFRQMSMYPFSISTDKDVPLQNFDRWTCIPKTPYDKIFSHDSSQIYLTIYI